MREAKLVDFNGNVIGTLPFPEKAEEVEYRQYIDMSLALIHCQDWVIQQKEKHGRVDPYQYLGKLVDVCAAFWQVDAKMFDNMELEALKPSQAVEMESSILDIVNYLVAMTNYEPKLPTEQAYTFKHKGEMFYMPYYRASAFAKQSFVRPPLTVGESIYALEASRLYNLILETEGDPEGSHRYTTQLMITAALARPPHMKIPDSFVALDQYVKDRVHFFEDISMVPVRDIAFFLTTTRQKYKMSPSSRISSTLRNGSDRTNMRSGLLAKLRRLTQRFTSV